MVTVERVVNCPFSLSLEYAHLLFRTLDAPGPGVLLPFRVLGVPFAGSFSQRVSASFHREPDVTEPGRLHDEVDFDWSAPSRWLPDFHGVLRMRIENLNTRVTLQGDYLPPFGWIGAFFDRLLGRRLARGSATDLVDRFARALEVRWANEKTG